MWIKTNSQTFVGKIMAEFGFELQRCKRSDGSVSIQSSALPMFHVIGDDEENAWAVACQLLPEYLRANYPDFVDWRTLESITKLLPLKKDDTKLPPVSVIAIMEAKSAAEDLSKVA